MNKIPVARNNARAALVTYFKRKYGINLTPRSGIILNGVAPGGVITYTDVEGNVHSVQCNRIVDFEFTDLPVAADSTGSDSPTAI